MGMKCVIIYLRDTTNCWDTLIGFPVSRNKAQRRVNCLSELYPTWKFQIVELEQ